ncbi:MAG TPA: Ig-like domain-containing protein [bacterium]|nr:Ig-like domain-containing protein [bacterium]
MKRGIIAFAAALLFVAGCGQSDEPFQTIDPADQAIEQQPPQGDEATQTPPVASGDEVILPGNPGVPNEEVPPPSPTAPAEDSGQSDQDCAASGDCPEIGTPPLAALTVTKTNSTGQNAHPNGGIIVTFSAPVDPASVTTDSLVLTPYRKVTKVSRYLGMDRAYFFIVETREEDTPYTATVKKGIKSQDGGVLTEDFTWYFKTGDFSQPRVTGVVTMTHSIVWVVFSEPIDMASCIEKNCIQVNNVGTILPVPVSGTLSLAAGGGGKIVAFTSDEPMAIEHDDAVYGSGAYFVTAWGADEDSARAASDKAGNTLVTTYKKNLADTQFKFSALH